MNWRPKFMQIWGTLWKNANEGGDNAHYTYDEAVSRFGNKLPTTEQLEELQDKCAWQRTTQNGVNGYKVIGPNGNSIFLPAAGNRDWGDGGTGFYWSSTLYDSVFARNLYFYWSEFRMGIGRSCRAGGHSVRLVQN